MTKTNVYFVCDCSGSMAGLLEETMRAQLQENIQALAGADGDFNIHVVPFSGSVRRPTGEGVNARVAKNRGELIAQVNTNYPFGGQTALRDAIGAALLHAEDTIERTPALVMVFTDGMENRSMEFSTPRLRALVEKLERTANLTLTVAGPASVESLLAGLGVSKDNFRRWDGSEKELRAVGAATTKGLASYAALRSTGATRMGSFYADASQLTPSGIRAMTKKVDPTEDQVVTPRMAGRAIADFFGTKFRKGHHFYELVKAEYIEDGKDLIVLIKSQNEFRLGSRSVRTMLGLPEDGRIRVHPSTAASPYVIFVRSDSVNRKVVAGQRLLTVED